MTPLYKLLFFLGNHFDLDVILKKKKEKTKKTTTPKNQNNYVPQNTV
jgi:hypothetical protein